MTRMYETLPVSRRLQLALQIMTPTQLAQTFAAYIGQFYRRSDFDALACQVNELYDRESAEHARLFRSQLDRRLYDRYHAPVAWDGISSHQDDVA